MTCVSPHGLSVNPVGVSPSCSNGLAEALEALECLDHLSVGGSQALSDVCRAVIEQFEQRWALPGEVELLTARARAEVRLLCDDIRSELNRRTKDHVPILGTLGELDSLWLDALLEARIATTGSHGLDVARQFREAAELEWEQVALSPEPWRCWRRWHIHDRESDGPAALLAMALWFDEIGPLTNDRAAEKSACLSTAVIRPLLAAFWAKRRILANGANGSPTTILDRDGAVVAEVTATRPGPSVVPDFQSLFRAARTVAGQRLLRWLVHEGFRRAGAGEHDFRKIVVPGGFSGLAHALGISSKRVTEDIRDALALMHHVHVRLPSNEVAGLLTWMLTPESPQRRAQLHIVLSDALLPNYTSALPKGTASKQEARKLVPLPRLFPPFVGHQSSHAAQAVLQVLVVRELRRLATALVQTGSAHIPAERWSSLADEAGLNRDLVDDVRNAWANGTTASPAFLVAVGDDRYTLAPDYENELIILLEGGRQEIEGKARQRRTRRALGRHRGRR